MPKETPHRQTSPPARGGYSTPYNDRGRGGFSRGSRGSSGGYSRGGSPAYQQQGGYSYRGGNQRNPPRGGYPVPPAPVMPTLPFGSPQLVACLTVGFNQGFTGGFFPTQDWQGMSAYGPQGGPPPGMMMGYPTGPPGGPGGPMMEQPGAGPHGLKRQRDG
jgi:hypothetical protein